MMRIISNFKDYYDSVQMYGVDPNLIYNRVTVEYEQFNPDARKRLPDDIHIPLNPVFNILKSMPKYIRVKGDCRDSRTVYRGIIGFCGRLIPFFVKPGGFGVYGNGPSTFEYDLDNLGELDTDKYSIYDDWYINPTTWGNVLKQCDQQFDSVFQSLDTPLFMVTTNGFGYDIIINPELKKFKFYRLKPAAEAYQDIAMYLGCQLAKESVVHNVPDKYLIEKKGFDIKTSFRHRT